jgi:hypothetical protein
MVPTPAGDDVTCYNVTSYAGGGTLPQRLTGFSTA